MQRQYGAGADGVPMGKWVAEGTSGGASMGFFDGYASPVQWKLAQEFVRLHEKTLENRRDVGKAN